MSRIFVHGCGAVSPAGWGVAALVDALEQRVELPVQQLNGPGFSFRVRTAPGPSPRPACLQHPRLRRASAISHFATAAALEALGESRKPGLRLGIVFGVHAASIRSSEKFFSEVLRDPSTASPVFFPETVINAPASHLAAVLNATELTYSALGDQTAFFQALLIGAGWLANDRADIVLVVSAEETAWTVSAAACSFAHDVICSEGAGAICLMRDESPVELAAITEPALFVGVANRAPSTVQIAAQFARRDEFLCDSRTGSRRWDCHQSEAWNDWTGPVLSPRMILGEAWSAATAWQFVAATERIRAGKNPAAVVSASGSNQQAIAARLKHN